MCSEIEHGQREGTLLLPVAAYEAERLVAKAGREAFSYSLFMLIAWAFLSGLTMRQ